jgi:biotin-dependent carboxylase-like uncharacterized protein
VIEIVKTAALNSVQDLGRHGARNLGVTASGALDTLALRAANIMLGNARGDAALEVQMFPLTVRFSCAGQIALAGGECVALLNDRRVPPWWTLVVQAGDTLVLRPPVVGVRCYLAVRGGLDVPPVMGSRSTAMRHGFGGHEGRAVRAGDRLAAGPAPAMPAARPDTGVLPPASVLGGLDAGGLSWLRVLPAAEYDLFTRASQRAFQGATWRVTAQSDRMGYRLSGSTLEKVTQQEMRSHPIVPGVVQVPPSGLPIIQLADGNAAGGYPKIACVIEADLWRLAQAAPGAGLRFRHCDLADARQARQEIEEYLNALRPDLAGSRPVRREAISANHGEPQ